MNVDLLYVEAFKRVALQYNVVIGIRAPNPLGKSLLREGYPSKNFHMKAKSSTEGPTAGFIAEKPIYSKVAITHHNKQAQAFEVAVNKGSKMVDLVITPARIDELIRAGKLNSNGNGSYSAMYSSGLQKFIIKEDGRVLDGKLNPVRVMTNPKEVGSDYINPKPITADYDLFTIIPHKNQSNNSRPLQLAPRLLHGKFKLDFLKPQSIGGRSEDANRGNLHFFGEVIVNKLNIEI